MTPARSVYLVYYVCMGLLYMGLGVAMLIYRNHFDLGPAINIMGGACIVYGIFRLYRAYGDYRQARREDAFDNPRRHRGV